MKQDKVWECHTYLMVASKIILKNWTVELQLELEIFCCLEILWVVIVKWNGPHVVSWLLERTIHN